MLFSFLTLMPVALAVILTAANVSDGEGSHRANHRPRPASSLPRRDT
ncbi:hypothetical protein ABT403_34780 [Streptomyces sp. NPDC000075]